MTIYTDYQYIKIIYRLPILNEVIKFLTNKKKYFILN